MTCENYRTSFYFLPSNPFTYCKATLVRIVDNVQHKNLGRQTNRRSSPMELAPTPSWYQGRGGKFGCLCQEVRGPFRALSSWAEKEFCHQRKVTRWWLAPQWTPKNFPPPIFHQRIWVQIFFCAVLVIQESFFSVGFQLVGHKNFRIGFLSHLARKLDYMIIQVNKIIEYSF